MGVDHGGFDVFVTEEFLDADIVAALEEVGSEGVAEDMATDAFGNGCRSYGLFKCFLESAFVEMVALPSFGIGVLDAATRGKTHCQIHSLSAFGYLWFRAKGSHAEP